MTAREMYRRYPVTITLIAVNIIVFIICEIYGSTLDTAVLYKFGGLHPEAAAGGQWYRLFTAMFLHSGIHHLLNNMVLLGALGIAAEREAGHVRMAVIYLLGGLAGNIASLIRYLRIGENVVSVGASGCIFAVMGGLVFMVIRGRGQITGYSVKQMLLLLAMSLYFSFVGSNIAVTAHLYGLAAGFLLAVLLCRKKAPRA